MSTVYEIESIIRNSISHEIGRLSNSYTLKSFPEILLMRIKSCYTLTILNEHRNNKEVLRRYEKLAISLRASKVSIENRILDKYRNIIIIGSVKNKVIPVYYKNCVFTDSFGFVSENCENCIVEGG